MAIGDRIKFNVAEIEFVEGGNTIWVHNENGMTVLRIKTLAKITVRRGCENVCPHSDILTKDPIDFCIPDVPDEVNDEA